VTSDRLAGASRAGVACALFDLSSYDAMGLAELIRIKQITPAEVVEDTIRKIEAVNPKLNAVICKTYARARQQASQAIMSDRPLAGVPFLVKDNAVIAGIALTRGSRALRAAVPNQTGPFFAAAEQAGLIVLGVTNMPEMGLIDGTESALYGPTRNPWNLDYSPGGSSGGSATCVAAGILPLAHGTDGGGSIRLPASHCGLFGLKASRGRLLPGGFGASPWPRLVDGCISRSVRDTAMYLSLVEDPSTRLPKLGFVSAKSRRRLKIALTYEGTRGEAPHPEVRKAIAATARLCRELGHTVDEANVPLDQARVDTAARQLARISHTIFARSGGVARRFVRTCWLVASGGRERSWDFPGLRGAAKTWSRWAWDDAAVVTRCGGACHAGEPRALAAALRRTAAQPQTSAAGQLDAIAILMRRTLTRTSAPILSSLRRIVPQLALANGV